jgi:deoxyadenosine/deoxycytidine kinase
MPLYFLEGGIGSGKSTFLKSCEGVPGLRVVYEPVDDWMNLKSAPDQPSIFELYYSDKTKYGFIFQMVALQTRIEHLLKILETVSNEEVILCERSFLTDNNVFAKLVLNETELVVYNQWYNFLIGLIKPNIDGIVYLRTTPEVCMERIRKRNRIGEENIDDDYLTKLHIQHDNWLLENKENMNIPVMIINGNIENIEFTYSLKTFLKL